MASRTYIQGNYRYIRMRSERAIPMGLARYVSLHSTINVNDLVHVFK